MSLIDLDLPWLTQPDFTARLRPEIEQWRPSVLLGNFGPNALSGKALTLAGSVPLIGSPYGLAYQGDATDNIAYGNAEKSFVFNTDKDFTWIVVFRKHNTSVDGNAIAGLGATGGSSGNTLFRLTGGGSSADAVRVQAQDSSGTTLYYNDDSSSIGLTDLMWHCVIVKGRISTNADDAYIRYFADGKQLNSVNTPASALGGAATFNQVSACGSRRGGSTISPGAFSVAFFAHLDGVRMPDGWCVRASTLDGVWDALFWPEDGAVPVSAAAGITGPLIGRGRLMNSPLIAGRLVQ